MQGSLVAAAALFLLVAGAEGIASSCAAARPALARALVRHRVAVSRALEAEDGLVCSD